MDHSLLQARIVQLPPDILFKIFKLTDIQLVCKQFYQVYCNFTSCGITFDASKLRNDVFDSMMNSLRRPYRFTIENHEQCSESSKLKRIVERFGIHVRELKFMRGNEPINITDYDFIVRSMVNVVEAIFDNLSINGKVGIGYNPIVLPKLKKLMLDQCEFQSQSIILQIVASSLEEFRVQNQKDYDFTEFFRNHSTITRIAMCQIPEQPRAFNHLQLTHLQIYACSNLSHLCDIISRQPKLRFLNLLYEEDKEEFAYWMKEDESDSSVNDKVFTEICKLKELETLKVRMGNISPDNIKPDLVFANLKDLVMKANGNIGNDFDNDYDNDVNKMQQDVNFQKLFRKLITIPMPTLQSFRWSLKNCEVDDEYFCSDEEVAMTAVRQREYSTLGDTKINVFMSMAKCFPNLKCLRIDMTTSNDIFNIHTLLKLFPHLETIELEVNSVFEGDSIQMHENIKHVKIQRVKQNELIGLMDLMPNLESLEICDTKYDLKKNFLLQLQASVPNSLKSMKLKLHSSQHNDFGLDNIGILEQIVKNLTTYRVKLAGNCNFDTLCEKFKKSIDRKMRIYLPQSTKRYYPDDDWDDHQGYMELWK